MNNYLIMVSSFTSAMRGKEILRNNGIQSEVIRTFNKEAGGGCGYSIKVYSDEGIAEKILRDAGINIMIGVNLEVRKDDIS